MDNNLDLDQTDTKLTSFPGLIEGDSIARPLVDNNKNMDDNKTGNSSIRLAKNVNLLNGITIIVGSIIGSGIFISPKAGISYAGGVGASLIIWLASGLMVTFGALSFSELGTTITESGGDYTYIYEIFGPFCAFLYLWVNITFVRPILIAIVTISFGEYVLAPFVPRSLENSVVMSYGAQNVFYAKRLTAAFGLLLLMLINSYSVKLATRIQDVLTLAKLAALGIIIAIGIMRLCQGHLESFKNPFENTSNIKQISLGFYGALFSYGGWSFLNIVTGEMKNPKRDLPLSIIIGMPIVTVIYVLTNVAYLTVLSATEMKASDTVAFDFAVKINYYLAWAMPIFAGLSSYGSANAVLFTSGRIFFIGSQKGHLPQILSMINVKWITPMPAIISLTLISMFYVMGRDIYVMMNIMSFIFYFFTTVCIVGLLYYRIKRPDLPRPIKLNPLIHLVFLITCAFILITSLITNYKDMLSGVAMLILGIPVYFIFVKKYVMPRSFFRMFDKMTRSLQKLMYVVPSEEEKEEIAQLDEQVDSTEMRLAVSSLKPEIHMNTTQL